MFRRTAPLLLLALASCSGVGRSPRQEVEWFQRGFYLGGSAGVATSTASESNLEHDVEDIQPGSEITDYDDTDFAWKAYAGYRFNAPFAIEGGWVELGEITSDIATTATDVDDFLSQVEDIHPFLGAGPFLGARYYVIDTNRFHIGIGGGLWWWNAKVKVKAGTGEKMDPEDDKIDGFFGVNAIWDFTERFSIRADYERYYLDDFEADVFTAGLQYRIL
jgi:OOP family OmpA-OmpF porin